LHDLIERVRNRSGSRLSRSRRARRAAEQLRLFDATGLDQAVGGVLDHLAGAGEKLIAR
jgi:hypothetical protein